MPIFFEINICYLEFDVCVLTTESKYLHVFQWRRILLCLFVSSVSRELCETIVIETAKRERERETDDNLILLIDFNWFGCSMPIERNCLTIHKDGYSMINL